MSYPGLTIFFLIEALEEDGETGAGEADAEANIAATLGPLDLTGDVEACR